MAKGMLVLIIVLILVFLGVGFFAALNYNTDKTSQNLNSNSQNNNQIQKNQYNSALPSVNSCGSDQYSYLCFKYQMLEQEKSQGYNNKPEQTRVEPCPAPKPVCPLCYPGLDQTKGEGYGNGLEQVRTNC